MAVVSWYETSHAQHPGYKNTQDHETQDCLRNRVWQNTLPLLKACKTIILIGNPPTLRFIAVKRQVLEYKRRIEGTNSDQEASKTYDKKGTSDEWRVLWINEMFACNDRNDSERDDQGWYLEDLDSSFVYLTSNYGRRSLRPPLGFLMLWWDMCVAKRVGLYRDTLFHVTMNNAWTSRFDALVVVFGLWQERHKLSKLKALTLPSTIKNQLR